MTFEVVENAWTETPHSITRRTIARRLTEAKATTPHFYVKGTFLMGELMALRSKHKAEGVSASINDYLVKAVASALTVYPQANVTWTDTALRQHQDVDVAVAVATSRGLITPIVRRAQAKTVTEIGAEVRDFAARAKAGKLKPEEYNGGTTTVSNLGMYGVEEFSAILNPPQATIFAFGAAEKRPYISGEKLEIGDVMTVTLSVDHRSLDGEGAARLLAAFKEIVQSPEGVLV